MFVHKNIQYYRCGQYKKNRGIKLFYTSAFIIKRSMGLVDHNYLQIRKCLVVVFGPILSLRSRKQ